MTTGAGNDIERATDIARKMVCEWGMSELGPLSFGKKEEQIFLGREIAQHRDYSEETAIKIDDAVRAMVQAAYARAERVIEEHAAALERIAMALLERETIDGEDVHRVIDNGGPAMSEMGPLPASEARQSVHAPLPEQQSGLDHGFLDGESPAPA